VLEVMQSQHQKAHIPESMLGGELPVLDFKVSKK
jgi:hypothetical protein